MQSAASPRFSQTPCQQEVHVIVINMPASGRLSKNYLCGSAIVCIVASVCAACASVTTGCMGGLELNRLQGIAAACASL